ncbi:MAG: GNAT family protein [Pseudomonadota bacterium]
MVVARQPASRVDLRPLQETDASRIRRWMADLELLRFTVQVPGADYLPVRPYLPAEADRYLHEMRTAPGRQAFAIELDGQHVGNTGLKNIDLKRRVAECFIEIGEPWARGQGVGHRAMQKLMAVAFDELGLEVLWLGVFEFNLPAIRLYQRLGFQPGPLYGEHHVAGEVHQVLGMWFRRRGRPRRS